MFNVTYFHIFFICGGGGGGKKKGGEKKKVSLIFSLYMPTLFSKLSENFLSLFKGVIQ